jgi:EAL domain-containing protein (putative c-di-GMP-specific phosphodiesterase class I)
MSFAMSIPEFISHSIPSPASPASKTSTCSDITTPLREIIQQRKLTALFQPILNLKSGEFYGYEGLIRGPSDSTLHSPLNLFGAAAQQNLTLEVEMLSRQIVLETFVQLNLKNWGFHRSG